MLKQSSQFRPLMHKNPRAKELLINYGLFYVGLNDDAYFWEVGVSNARKIIFISCSTFFSMS
jgi:hypothetical protein